MSVTIVSPGQYKNHPTFRNVSLDALPRACRTDGTLCSGFLLSNAPCRIRQDRGCLLRGVPGFELLDKVEVWS